MVSSPFFLQKKWYCVLGVVSGLVVLWIFYFLPAPPPPVVGVWLPWWSQKSAIGTLLQNRSIIRQVYFFAFSLGQKGEIQAKRLPISPRKLKRLSFEVFATVANHGRSQPVHRILSNPTLRKKHIQQLVNMVQNRGFDGLEVDYESLKAEDRQAFSVFIQNLAHQLRQNGKKLAVAVHAKISSPGTWNGPQAQDWRVIGKAVDYFKIMGYDYGWLGGKPNPIAPLPWLERVLRFAVSQVKSNKIILGIPLYGYRWYHSKERRNKAHTFVQLQRFLSAAYYHPRYQELTLQTSEFTLWFHDWRSVAARAKLAQSFGILGVCLWRMGGEDPRIWEKSRNVFLKGER
ncbi:MAG: hypothetical protein D6805_04415 [Planctomycetota bacterium]|nr:MAG: hypothetical protein D6805_04415 [Planctomycetota bacterium]